MAAARDDGIAPQPDPTPVPDSALRFIGFLAFFDRYATAPMLLALSLATELSLGQAVQLVAGYSLFYALGQPIWGILSDRFGRLTVLRTALLGAVLGALASTLFTAYLPLLVVRSLTGLMFGALYPTLLTLLGDTRTGIQRARGLSDLQIYSSLGTTLSTLAAGALATFVDWRLVFALPALGAVAALLSLRKVIATPRATGAFTLRPAFTKSTLVLYAVVFLEGGLLMGLLIYIVPALQELGIGIGLAGVLGCSFALGVILGARLMRRLVARFSRTWLIGLGALILVCGFAASAFWFSAVSLTLTATLMGAANAIMHSSMQGWATDVAPTARATTVSFFVFSLFFGASIGTWLTASLAETGSYATIFQIGFYAALLLSVLATATHQLWYRRNSQEPT